MAYYEKYLDEGGVLHIVHKDAEIVEFYVKNDLVMTKKHTVHDKESPYYAGFLTAYDQIPILSISTEADNIFNVTEFINMETREYKSTYEDVITLLVHKGINPAEAIRIIEELLTHEVADAKT